MFRGLLPSSSSSSPSNSPDEERAQGATVEKAEAAVGIKCSLGLKKSRDEMDKTLRDRITTWKRISNMDEGNRGAESEWKV